MSNKQCSGATSNEELAMKKIISLLLLIMINYNSNLMADEDSSKKNSTNKETATVIIRSIIIDNQNIFNPKIKGESGFIYRLANSLHIKTRKGVAKEYLLFNIGEALPAHTLKQKMEESERILRAKSGMQDAAINYILQGNQVDVAITTKDSWSLKPKLSYSHKGDANKAELGLQEDNLFGLGIRTSLSYRSDNERNSTVLKIRDDNAFGHWYSAGITYIDSSDGSEQKFDFSKPFYALDTTQSYGIEYSHVDKITTLYNKGREQYNYRADTQSSDVFWGFSSGLVNNNVIRHRFGLYSDDNIFELSPNPYISNFNTDFDSNTLIHQSLTPKNHQSRYPYYAFDFLQNNYTKMTNFKSIGRIEDIYTGFKAGFKMGYGLADWGNDENRFYAKAYAQKMFDLGNNQMIFLSANIDGRLADTGSQNVISSLDASYYQAHSKRFKGYINAYAKNVINADEQNALYLDTESGLRGYPLNYIGGDRLQKITLEERFYSDWYLWRIFNIGAAAFFDIGHISGCTKDCEQSTYRDIGIGLRLANHRSSRGDIIHIDISYPMDLPTEDRHWKFAIESKKTF